MPSIRALGLALAAGVVHAAGLLLVATDLGYAVGPSQYSLAGLAWRYGGLVVVAALPVWLAVRRRLVTPVVALALASAWVVGMELAPPGPTFYDVAELEGLSEPTGITVVENGNYVVRYMVDAAVWTLGFLLCGLVEHVSREAWTRLPPVSTPVPWLSAPAPRRRALAVASAGGACHAAVMTWYAARLGLTISERPDWPLYLYGAVGSWALAAVPLYLLLRRRLVAPATLLALFVLFDAQAAMTARVEGPHALYFAVWFVFLGGFLLAGGVEWALRRLDLFRGVASRL